MRKPPLSIVFCFYLSAIGEVVAILRDANLLVQLAFAFAVCVCASCLNEGGPRTRRLEKRRRTTGSKRRPKRPPRGRP
jgi:hypothetical protein